MRREKKREREKGSRGRQSERERDKERRRRFEGRKPQNRKHPPYAVQRPNHIITFCGPVILTPRFCPSFVIDIALCCSAARRPSLKKRALKARPHSRRGNATCSVVFLTAYKTGNCTCDGRPASRGPRERRDHHRGSSERGRELLYAVDFYTSEYHFVNV